MKGLIYLSGEYPDLSRAELEGVLLSMGKGVGFKVEDEIVCLLDEEVPPGLAERMGLCHFTGTVLEEVTGGLEEISDAVLETVKKTGRGRRIAFTIRNPKGRVCVKPARLHDLLTGLIREEGIKLDFGKPDETFFIVLGRTNLIGAVEGITDRPRTLSRRNRFLPFQRPVVMDPRMARAMANMSGLTPGESVLDPFAGPGGLASECADIGLRVVGVEVDPRVREGAVKNLEHMGVGGRVRMICGDSRELPWRLDEKTRGPFSGIVTDPPFGRSARVEGDSPLELVAGVINRGVEDIRKGGVVVIDTIDPYLLDLLEGLKQEKTVQVRVHRSMIRHFSRLRKVH